MLEKLVTTIIDKKIDEKIKRFIEDNSHLHESNRYFTVKQAAEYINVSTRTIYNYLESKIFNKIYFGSSLRIDKKEIILFAEQQKSKVA